MKLRPTHVPAFVLFSLAAAACGGGARRHHPAPMHPHHPPHATAAVGDTGLLPFRVEVEVTEMASDPVFQTAPRLQSAAFGVSPTTGRWLIIGGRTNGFHGFTTTANFPRAYANDTIYVIDPAGTAPNNVWRYPVARLSAPEAIRDQFIATNFQHTVGDDGVFYVTGGYGVENVSGADTTLVTYPMITAMPLDSVIAAVVAGQDPSSLITYTRDTTFQVTGGELLQLHGTYYLIMGNRFTGKYMDCINTVGSPCQQYTNAIRPFTVSRASGKPVPTWGTAQIDSGNFHRRDLTVAPTIFADGTEGIAAYSGVFVPPQASQADASLPYLYPVYIGKPNPAGTPDRLHPLVEQEVRARTERGERAAARGVAVDSIWRDDSFLQRMNQYSAANLLMFDPRTRTMFTTLFGGIGHYIMDGPFIVSAGYPPGLQQDPNDSAKTIFNDRAPFIPYVTTQVRNTLPSGRMVTVERVHARELPGFLGGEARFVPAPALRRAGQMYRGNDEVIDYTRLTGRTFVGWIYGGMEAFAEAAYPDWKAYGQFDSRASTKVMRVYVTPR